MLAANLILDKVPALNQETNLRKSIVLERDGVKIGVIGYLTSETKFLAPKNDVEYEDEVIAIRREVENLKKQDVNIFIALGHSGFTKDLEIARDVEDLDLVIGGHSNTFLWNSPRTNEKPERVEGPYPVEVRHPSGRIVRVVQAYAYTKYLGSLNIIFDRHGEIVHCEGNPILLDQQMPRDPELLKIVGKYSSEIDRINNVVVGNSSVTLHGEYCRLRECNLGVVIADATVNYTKENFDQYRDVNIAIVQGGRIRTSIDRPQKPYEMTRGDWVTVMPFTDTLAVVTMDGSILLDSLEHSVLNWKITDAPGHFLQFSGLRVVYDLAQPPGSRVVSAKALSNRGELSDILEGKEYRVIMCMFLAEGGDGYANFENLPKDILSFNEVDAVIYYLSRIGLLSQGDTGRLTLLNTDKVNELQVQYHTNTISSSIQILSSKNLRTFCILSILSYFALEIYL